MTAKKTAARPKKPGAKLTKGEIAEQKAVALRYLRKVVEDVTLPANLRSKAARLVLDYADADLAPAKRRSGASGYVSKKAQAADAAKAVATSSSLAHLLS